MDSDTMDSIESAVKSGNAAFFNEVEVDVIRNFRDAEGNPVLCLAAIYGYLNCCEVIYRRCPESLYMANKHGTTALHQAAWCGHDHVVKFLLGAAHGGKPGDMNVDYKLLMMVEDSKQTALHNTVIKNYPHITKLIVEVDSSNTLLRMADYKNETPMHMAVRNHNLEIVKLLLDRDPTVSYAPNQSGQTPHLMALQESSSGDRTTVGIMKLLIEKQPDECKRQTREDGWTLLHHAVNIGNVSAIEDILEFCPDSAKLVDNNGQNFFHLAVKFENEKVVRHILGSTKVDDSVLKQQDFHGNTPFHIATSKGNANIGLLLLYNPRIDKFVRNKEGETALAAINFDFDKRRAGVHGFIDRVNEKDLKDRSDFDLLVGALISTVSFTVGITVPGGFFSEGPNKGNAVLYQKASFEVFIISNTIALVLSLYAVFSHFCTKHLTDTKDIIYQLQVATFCSLGSIFAMMIAFITGSYAVLAISARLSITVCVICCCFFVFAIRAMWKMIRQKRTRR